jgi:subtilisin family serine protease
MTSRLALSVLLAAACIGARGSEVAIDVGGAELATGRVAARFHDATALPALLDARHRQHDGIALDEIVTREPLRVILRVRSGSPLDALRLARELTAAAGASYAVPERFREMELRNRFLPDDPLFAQQWTLENTGQAGNGRLDPAAGDVDAPEAWSYTLGSPQVLIAVLDDGVQLDHPDLVANIASAGRDFTVDPPVAGASPKTVADRHGTSVAGIAAARGGNGVGVSGMCPRCRVLPIRVHGSSNLGTAAAFRYAIEQGADVITNSWGYARAVPAGADAAVRDAIDTAAHEGRGGRGTLIVFGMTNESVDNCSGAHTDISSLESVVAVGVSNHDDEVGGAGFGACMDLVAPAKPKDRSTLGVMTTDRTGLDGHAAGDYYSDFGGTSAAAPLVAGIAGLLLSLNPALTRADLQRILEHTAEKVDPSGAAYDAAGFSERAGYGRVNAARALVPTVKIAVTPARVQTGEPFTVTVTASAPFGLESVWWVARGTGSGGLDAPQRRALEGEYVRSIAWSGVTIDTPGTYTLAADARDVRHADAADGYPHRAGARAPEPTVQLTVVERSDAVSR